MQHAQTRVSVDVGGSVVFSRFQCSAPDETKGGVQPVNPDEIIVVQDLLEAAWADAMSLQKLPEVSHIEIRLDGVTEFLQITPAEGSPIGKMTGDVLVNQKLK